MTITVSTADPRSVKALALLEGAARWQKGHTHDGRSFYCVPSATVPGLLHMASTRDCSCKDREHRGVDCCHMLAVRLHVARLGAERQATPKAKPAPVFSGSCPLHFKFRPTCGDCRANRGRKGRPEVPAA
jgi:hypothetical protein